MESQALASSIPISSAISTSAFPHGSRASSSRLRIFSGAVWRKLGMRNSARASSSTGDALVSTCPPLIAPKNPISKFNSPLLWIAVGVGLSAWFTVMATKVKRYAINQAFKAVVSEEAEANGQFNTSAFASGSPFPSISAATQPAEASDNIYIDELNGNIPPADTVITDNKNDEIDI